MARDSDSMLSRKLGKSFHEPGCSPIGLIVFCHCVLLSDSLNRKGACSVKWRSVLTVPTSQTRLLAPLVRLAPLRFAWLDVDIQQGVADLLFGLGR